MSASAYRDTALCRVLKRKRFSLAPSYYVYPRDGVIGAVGRHLPLDEFKQPVQVLARVSLDAGSGGKVFPIGLNLVLAHVMFKIDQIVFENESYIKFMSIMVGQDFSLFGVLERSDSNHINIQKVSSEYERLKGFILTSR
jgi:hypothetical protein